jgi:hypothetical protein
MYTYAEKAGLQRNIMDELKIRLDKEENKYYVYFDGPFGSCAYSSDPFDTLEAAEAFKQEQENSADFGDEE